MRVCKQYERQACKTGMQVICWENNSSIIQSNVIELTKMVITAESEERGESEGEKHSGTVHMRSDSMLQKITCVNQKHSAWYQKRCQACRSQAVAREAKTGRKEANMNIQ